MRVKFFLISFTLLICRFFVVIEKGKKMIHSALCYMRSGSCRKIRLSLVVWESRYVFFIIGCIDDCWYLEQLYCHDAVQGSRFVTSVEQTDNLEVAEKINCKQSIDKKKKTHRVPVIVQDLCQQWVGLTCWVLTHQHGLPSLCLEVCEQITDVICLWQFATAGRTAAFNQQIYYIRPLSFKVFLDIIG